MKAGFTAEGRGDAYSPISRYNLLSGLYNLPPDPAAIKGTGNWSFWQSAISVPGTTYPFILLGRQWQCEVKWLAKGHTKIEKQPILGLNPGPPGYKANMLTTRPICLHKWSIQQYPIIHVSCAEAALKWQLSMNCQISSISVCYYLTWNNLLERKKNLDLCGSSKIHSIQ